LTKHSICSYFITSSAFLQALFAQITKSFGIYNREVGKEGVFAEKSYKNDAKQLTFLSK